MKPVFTFDEIREVEKKIIENEIIPSIVLMENAGRNSFDIIAKEFRTWMNTLYMLFAEKAVMPAMVLRWHDIS